jgi:hypothetical protein
MFCFKLGKITPVLPAIAPFLCFAAIVVLQSQEYKKTFQQLDYANYLSQENQQARLIEFQEQSPNLGFDNLMADWSYLNFVQYFGDTQARETIGYQLVSEYFATIANIDPRFTQAHLRLSLANSMYAGNAEETIALMNQILTSVAPESQESALLWTSKGLDELLFLGNKEAAINSYKIAAQWAELSKSNTSDVLTIKDLEEALKFTNEIDLKEAQVRAWSGVLIHIRDHQQKQEIINKIEVLQAEILALKQTSPEPVKISN